MACPIPGLWPKAWALVRSQGKNVKVQQGKGRVPRWAPLFTISHYCTPFERPGLNLNAQLFLICNCDLDPDIDPRAWHGCC
ncbi:hypothetical protein GGTG_14099 [Gaeumannomyces tritici R3-111a-1]|uniref:Uncharacterized protein n=1 Tax=Gaeumannomyces tritici (strain R3-111a-1) TaxID=644352 RepID=J3PKN6_GAET3|nr:hypothetical protein GGTG_14099 [Gaeumannomyces tritici R3-111a-1]EJT68319.1 hypothetical protein GGTG_14099 [Gaeumannomyces tritici R3-111a-1]